MIIVFVLFILICGCQTENPELCKYVERILRIHPENQTWCIDNEPCDHIGDDFDDSMQVDIAPNNSLRILVVNASRLMIYNTTDDLESPCACANQVQHTPFLESVLAQFAATPHDDATSTTCWKLVLSFHKCPSDNRGLMCSGNGLCLLREGRPQCHCCAGFPGPVCRESTCVEAGCQNGGTCIVSNGYAPVCACPANTTGSTCEVVLSPCWSSPCFHGVCVDKSSGYACFCVPGYHGPECRHEYNECDSNPCLNDGICEDMLDAFKCQCNHGYRGDKCEIKQRFRAVLSEAV